MAQQPQVQKQLFHYENVQILKDKCLGIGSYGAVYKAKCGELFCAAKILHPTIVPRGTRNWITDKFEQECNFLVNIRHPHIVLCLGVTTDPESGLKVLLMELMDESLTKFLEQSEKPLPYHIQVKLCHDITLALVFLHSNDIIHRDLSSNNILLIAGSRAKITDFGMSRIANVGPHRTPFTQCPGTQDYMPPEALKVRPVYTKKLDCFSFGVVGLQIMTALFPEPSDSERIVEDSKFRTGTLKVLVPELERRKNHIDLVDPNHPLLAVTLNCLKDKEKERPTAQELCRHLFSLKESPQYIESERDSKELTMGSVVKREKQIKERYEQQLQELRLQQEAKKSAAEAEILQVQKELQHKNKQVQRQLQQLQRQLQEQQKQLRDQQGQLQEQQGQLREYQTQLQHGNENQKPKLQQSIAKSCPTISGQFTRDDIVEAIREIKINPGQQLQHVEVSQDIYDMANNFARWAPNFVHGYQPYRFKMHFLYQLLQNNISSRTLQEATEEVEGWQSACKALLRYALNLLLAPKRPEFRHLKLSSSFYVYQVLRKLPKGAEKILVFMGYKPTTQDMQELKYEGDVNTERVLETAADLVILHSELDLVKELLQLAINELQCDTYVTNLETLHRILHVRAVTDEKYDDTWKYLVNAAYTPPQDMKNQLSQPRKLSTERPSSDNTAYGNRAQNKQRSQQEVKVVQIPGATPSKVHTSVSSCSFHEKLHNLFQQFPDLLESQDEGPAPSTSDPTYQNIGDVLQLEEAEKPQESLAPDTLNLPDPVIQSEAELEQLERYRQNQSGLMSINPEIKDGVVPCYGEVWTVCTETHPVTQFLIGAGNEGSTSDRLPSHSSSGTEDIYESAGGGANVSLEQESSLPSLRNKPASPSDVTLEVTDTKPVETSGSASVEHETLATAMTQQTVPRVVADCDDNSLSEPQSPKSSRPILQQQATIPESGSKLKPVPKPRSKLQDMHITSKSLDNEVEEEPKSPRTKPRVRNLMRNVSFFK